MRLALAAILLAFAALVLQLNLLAYALLVVLAVVWISRTVTARWTSQPSATRTVSSVQLQTGQIAEIRLEIRNRGRGTVLWMLLEELLPNCRLTSGNPPVEFAGDRIGILRLPGKSVRQWNYRLLFHRRGYYQLGPFVLETGDIFGLNRRFAVLANPDFVLVLPKIVPLLGYDVHSRRPIGEVVLAHRLFEDPTRIRGVRAYQPGDSFSRIHWRATARTAALQSKVFEPSSLSGATFLIDFHADSFSSADESVRSELAISAVASIANLLHEMGQQFGLLSNGRDALDRIRFEGWQGDSRTRAEARSQVADHDAGSRLRPVQLRTGRAPDQLPRLLELLARLEISSGLNLRQLVAEFGSELPRDATVVALVGRVNLDLAAALASLKRQGLAVTAIINCYEEEHFAQASGPLLNHGITTRHLKDEASIQTICQKAAVAR